MKVEDILDSDKRILDATRKDTQNGQHVLVFDFGELGTLTGAVPEKLDASIITEWCMAVRREYNARNNKPKAESVSKAADVRSPPDKAAADAGQPGGSGPAVPADLQGAKAAMEAGIESTLVELARRRAQIEARSHELNREVAALRVELSNLDDMVGFYNSLKAGLV